MFEASRPFLEVGVMELRDTATLFHRTGYEDNVSQWDVFLLRGVKICRERRVGVNDRAVMYVFPGRTSVTPDVFPSSLPEITPGDMILAGDRRDDDPATLGEAMRVTASEVFSDGSDGMRHVKVTLR